MTGYEAKIIEETGITKTELSVLVQEKKEDLKGLISDEGALYLVGKELGIFSTQNGEIKIKDLDVSGMKNISISGKIKLFRDVRIFTKRDGSAGKVGNFYLEDDTGKIKTVVWNDKTKIFNNPDFKIGALIQIEGAYTKWSDYSNAFELIIPDRGKITIKKVV